MEMESEIQKEFESIAELVVDMHDLRDSYKGFRNTDLNETLQGMVKIKKTEKKIKETYPKFEHVKKIEEVYSRLCSTAKTFYESEPVKEVFKRGFEGFTIPEPFQDYLHQKNKQKQL